MSETPAQRALTASAVSLLVAGGSLALFLPPLNDNIGESPLRAGFFGLALAAGLLLHWVFLAIAARRLGRSVAGWLALSVLLFPVGSVAALVLLAWFREEAEASPA